VRRTKIVCTIGPASSKRGVMEELLSAGMNVARLNFSHGTHEQHAQVIADLREVSRKVGRPLAILQDLCGPKVRLGNFAVESFRLKRGMEVGFVPSLPQTGEPHQHENGALLLPLPIPELLAEVTPRHTLLLDDGKISLKVTRLEGEPYQDNRIVWTRCVAGGEIKQRKGVTVPGADLSIPAVTEKDKTDLRFGLAQGVDWVAASYVRTAQDLAPIRAIMGEMGICRPIIAKIEKPEAVRNLDKILAVVEGIMVARGDMGVEMPFDEVPLVQKQIIRRCNQAGKPVITATQMLESMITTARPTRAEATDVANAILDGTDAVMLSGETAVGQYPVQSVRTMARIALRTEGEVFGEERFLARFKPASNVTEAVARAATEIAAQIKASAILCATTSGGTARRVAQYRPAVPILGITCEAETYRQLALSWGVRPWLIEKVHTEEEMVRVALEAALASKIGVPGEKVVVTAGVPVNNPGTTNLIEVYTL
jgi:pyruvate kinase